MRRGSFSRWGGLVIIIIISTPLFHHHARRPDAALPPPSYRYSLTTPHHHHTTPLSLQKVDDVAVTQLSLSNLVTKEAAPQPKDIVDITTGDEEYFPVTLPSEPSLVNPP